MATNWLRCLLGLLSFAEALMAVSAGPLLLAVGAAGGIALVVATWRGPTRKLFLLIVVAGTLPFAALARTAVVAIVLVLPATAIAAALSHRASHPAAQTGRTGLAPRPDHHGGPRVAAG